MVNKNLLLSSMSSLSSTGSISRICSQSGDSRYISVAILFLDLKFKRRYVESNKNIQKIWKSAAAQLREILQLGSLGKIGSPPLPLTPQTALNCHLFSGKNLSRLSRCHSVAAGQDLVQSLGGQYQWVPVGTSIVPTGLLYPLGTIDQAQRLP